MALCVQTGWAGKCQHQGGLRMAYKVIDGEGLALSHLIPEASVDWSC